MKYSIKNKIVMYVATLLCALSYAFSSAIAETPNTVIPKQLRIYNLSGYYKDGYANNAKTNYFQAPEKITIVWKNGSEQEIMKDSPIDLQDPEDIISISIQTQTGPFKIPDCAYRVKEKDADTPCTLVVSYIRKQKSDQTLWLVTALEPTDNHQNVLVRWENGENFKTSDDTTTNNPGITPKNLSIINATGIEVSNEDRWIDTAALSTKSDWPEKRSIKVTWKNNTYAVIENEVPFLVEDSAAIKSIEVLKPEKNQNQVISRDAYTFADESILEPNNPAPYRLIIYYKKYYVEDDSGQGWAYINTSLQPNTKWQAENKILPLKAWDSDDATNDGRVIPPQLSIINATKFKVDKKHLKQGEFINTDTLSEQSFAHDERPILIVWKDGTCTVLRNSEPFNVMEPENIKSIQVVMPGENEFIPRSAYTFAQARDLNPNALPTYTLIIYYQDYYESSKKWSSLNTSLQPTNEPQLGQKNIQWEQQQPINPYVFSKWESIIPGWMKSISSKLKSFWRSGTPENQENNTLEPASEAVNLETATPANEETTIITPISDTPTLETIAPEVVTAENAKSSRWQWIKSIQSRFKNYWRSWWNSNQAPTESSE